MNASSTPLLFSLKPHYAKLVFGGLKKVELRRRILTGIEGIDVFVYATSPVRKLQGGFRVGKVWTGTPEKIWGVVSKSACVEKPDFDAYYAGRDVACALEITETWEYSNPMGLSALRDTFQNFVVPQSWRYVKPQERQSFLRMERAGGVKDGKEYASLSSAAQAAIGPHKNGGSTGPSRSTKDSRTPYRQVVTRTTDPEPPHGIIEALRC